MDDHSEKEPPIQPIRGGKVHFHVNMKQNREYSQKQRTFESKLHDMRNREIDSRQTNKPPK